MADFRPRELTPEDIEAADSELVKDFYRIKRQRAEIRKLDYLARCFSMSLPKKSDELISEGCRMANEIEVVNIYDARLAKMVYESGKDLPSFKSGRRKEHLDRLMCNYENCLFESRVIKILKRLGKEVKRHEK